MRATHCQGCGSELPPPVSSHDVRRKWCSEDCRRQALYAGTCEDCGGPTDGSNGSAKAPARCQGCITWTRDQVIFALQEWAEESGGIPPTCTDARASDALPYERTVARLFGSWNGGLLAAGFALRLDRRSETMRAVLDALAAGESVASIAERYGWTVHNVYRRLRVRGLTVADARAGKRAA